MTLRSRFNRASRARILRVLLGMKISSSVLGAGRFTGRDHRIGRLRKKLPKK